MKEIKYILNSMFWAVYASSWWAAAEFGKNSTQQNPVGMLWCIPIALTVIVVVSFVMYCADNWHRD